MPSLIEDAEDGDSPKQTIIELVLAARDQVIVR